MRRMQTRLWSSILAAVLLVSCSQTSTAPGPFTGGAQATFNGVWSGEMTVRQCTGGEGDCWYYIGRTMPFVLRLAHAGSSVTGVLTVANPRAREAATEVSGIVGADGRVILSGSSTAPSRELASVIIKALVVTVDSTGTLSGNLEYEYNREAYPYGRGTYGGELRAADRRSLPGADTSGQWTGAFFVTACTPQGQPSCYPSPQPGEADAFDASLVQQGTAVTGSIRLHSRDVPVAGTMTGNRLLLSGTLTRTWSDVVEQTRIVTFDATVDKFGVMRANVIYDIETSAGGTTSRSTRLAGLWFVTRRE